jgi:hypothetical protein
MRTIKFQAAMGQHEGYRGDVYYSTSEIIKTIMDIERFRYEETGVYISVLVSPSRVVYNTVWGCPVEGEPSVILSGYCNLEFCNSIELYKQEVLYLMKRLQNEFKQQTIAVEFVECEVEYLKEGTK